MSLFGVETSELDIPAPKGFGCAAAGDGNGIARFEIGRAGFLYGAGEIDGGIMGNVRITPGLPVTARPSL